MNKRYALFGVFILFIILTACNKSTDENEKIYTENDVFIRSYSCAYIHFPYETVIIETEEQLDYAEQNYGLDLNGYFQEMKSQCSIEDYSYVVAYDMVNGEGHYLHADKIKTDKNGVYFLMDSKSHSPKSKVVVQVVSGFMHMAAIPKDDLSDCEFSDQNYIFPGE